jgi:hypothetical protein
MKANIKFLILLLFLISCEKNNDTIKDDFTIVGQVNDSIKVTTVDYMVGATYSAKKIYTYKLDINADSVKDIQFIVDNDTYGAEAFLIYSSFLSVKSLNNNVFFRIDSVYPNVLKNGDTISIKDNWKSGEFTLYNTINDGSNRYTYNGIWKNKDSCYIGIKYGAHLGWVKISTQWSSTIIKIHEYALMK